MTTPTDDPRLSALTEFANALTGSPSGKVFVALDAGRPDTTTYGRRIIRILSRASWSVSSAEGTDLPQGIAMRLPENPSPSALRLRQCVINHLPTARVEQQLDFPGDVKPCIDSDSPRLFIGHHPTDTYLPETALPAPLPPEAQARRLIYPRELVELLNTRLDYFYEEQADHGATTATDKWFPRPTMNHLRDLLDVIFFTSLMQEEGRPVLCSVVFASKAAAMTSEWVTAPFASPIDLSRETLRRLAPALDPDQSFIAVFPNDQGELHIWGTITPCNGEEGRSAPLGLLFRVLRQGVFTVEIEFQDLLLYSCGEALIMYERFSATDRQLWHLMSEGIPLLQLPEDDTVLPPLAGDFYAIAAKMLAHGHGGTLLIVPQAEINALSSRRHDVEASHWKLLLNAMRDRLKASAARKELPKDAPAKDHLAALEAERRASRRYRQALTFVAGLTRIDGALVMTVGLEVRAFGALIDFAPTRDLDGPRVRPIVPGEYTREEVPVPLTRFPGGARHQSAIHFVNSNLGSMAFVASQDGTLSFFRRLPTDDCVLAVRPLHRGIGMTLR